jgi:hypothetical protein
MITLFGVDKLHISKADIAVGNGWIAIMCSLLVGGPVYGKAKIDGGVSRAKGSSANDQRS